MPAGRRPARVGAGLTAFAHLRCEVGRSAGCTALAVRAGG